MTLYKSSVTTIPHVGSLNLCLKKPDSLQKESAQSDHPALSKRLKCGQRQNIPIFQHILDIFSRQDGQIELIPFALSQASWEFRLPTWGISEYIETIPLFGEPEQIISVNKILPQWTFYHR